MHIYFIEPINVIVLDFETAHIFNSHWEELRFKISNAKGATLYGI